MVSPHFYRRAVVIDDTNWKSGCLEGSEGPAPLSRSIVISAIRIDVGMRRLFAKLHYRLPLGQAAGADCRRPPQPDWPPHWPPHWPPYWPA